MGASFRNIGEITSLAGCDRLTIAPALLEELGKTEGTLQRVLTDNGRRRSDQAREGAGRKAVSQADTDKPSWRMARYHGADAPASGLFALTFFPLAL